MDATPISPLPVASRTPAWALAALVFGFALILCGCLEQGYSPKLPEVSDPSGVTNGMGRAEPGYVQWLERKSMLAKTASLAALVAQSPRQWRLPPLPPHPEALFAHADTWLALSPRQLARPGIGANEPLLRQLRHPLLWEALQKAHIRGLYLAPTGPGGDMWRLRGEAQTGDDHEVDISFSETLGNEQDYRELARVANRHGAILGGGTLASASGIGPDFFLAARAFRDYGGIYALIEIPREAWPLLPDVEQEWEGAPLAHEQFERLAQHVGLAQVRQAALPVSSGWAATQQVRGIDGIGRRFIYRWYDSPRQAVFNWPDPSRAAQRIASAALVRHVGQLGNALAGFALAPLMGLAPAATLPGPAPAPEALAAQLYPSLEAGVALGAQTRRYGGWSMGTDELPMTLLPPFLANGPDFLRDGFTSPAAEHALLTGNARLLRASVDTGLRLGLDGRRLVHVMPGQAGTSYAPLAQLAFFSAGLTEQEKATFSPTLASDERDAVPGAADLMRAQRLCATAPALAALAAGKAGAAALAPDAAPELMQGHLALLFFKAMQPGLLMLEAADTTGALPVAWQEAMASDRPDEVPISLGLGQEAAGPATPCLYPPLVLQAHQPDSFLAKASDLLARRQALGVAAGQLATRIKAVGPGMIVLATELPNAQGLLVSAVNFSRQPTIEHLNLARDLAAAGLTFSARTATDVMSGEKISVAGGFLPLHLAAWQARAFVLAPDRAAAPAETEEDTHP